MSEKGTETGVIRLLFLAVALWIGYLLALVLIDHLLYPRPLFPPVYYVINGLNALVVLGLALWPGFRRWLGSIFLPVVIVMMSVLPIITNQLVVRSLPPGPQTMPETTALRLMPVLFIALVLTAWQYRRRHIILFSGGTALFTLGLHILFFRPGGASFLPPMTVLVIQTVSFLIVGYFINTLMGRLKIQQNSLKQANAQLLHYASTLEHLTISRERNRMARELHDTLAHTLSALSVQLETVKAYWDVEPATAQRLLDQSLAATRSGLQETRRALKSLRASPLDDLGLALAIRKLVEETAARANLALDLSLPKHLPALSPDVQQCIYRVAQEAVANAAHHANARTLTVQLSVNGPDVSLLVRDDGLGFDVRQRKASGHFGLPGMRERAHLAGGQLTIDSQPEQGTTIQLIIEDQINARNHLRRSGPHS
ncbi:MAG: sensor histidine kinase [Chloroflexi bacterium]|nr:sensor histidine kinase [Chloroflexota bacterium]